MTSSLFDAFFALHPDLSPHRAGVESAFLGLARTIKQGGKIFVAGEGSFPLVSRLMNAPFRPLAALELRPEIDARRQIFALGKRYADGIWAVGASQHCTEALQAARENFFNTAALVENPPASLRLWCDALIECEDARLISAICEALSSYFSAERAFESVPIPREDVTENGYFADDFDDSDPFADEDAEVEIVEIDAVAQAVMEWEGNWKDARNVERGGASRAEEEAQKQAFLNRDWGQMTGVDVWGTHHHSLLARGSVEEVGAAIVSLCDAAQWDKNMLGETTTLGKSGYFLYRIAGQQWTVALPYQTAHPHSFDLKFREDLAEQLSEHLYAAFVLSYGDNPFYLKYELWQAGQKLESSRGDIDDDGLPIGGFSSVLAPELEEQDFDIYERCEAVMRDWQIYAPTLEAAYFTPFADIIDLQGKEGAEFETRNPGWKCYFGSSPAHITLPIERFDHIILAL